MYSAQEMGCIALQCPDAQCYHVQSECVLVEVLDGNGTPCRPGETGRIVTEEAAVHASNVMLYSTTKKVASRVEIVVDKDGTKKRRLKKTGETLD